jgi:hypothetical protein
MAKLIINDTTLSAIGDALRQQTGTADPIAPSQMAPMILSLKTDGIPADAFSLTGNCNYRFYADNWSWLIADYGYKMHSSNITNMAATFLSCKGFDDLGFELNVVNGVNCNQAFDGCEIKIMPIINGKIGTGYCMFRDSNIETARNYECDSLTGTYTYEMMFYNANKLQTLPYLINRRPSDCNCMFSYCSSITDVPADYFDTWQISGTANLNGMFAHCHSLRRVPTAALQGIFNGRTGATYHNLFSNCYALDELVGLPTISLGTNFNYFSNAFTNCYRLKSITFETEADGTPKTTTWKNQTLDLTTVGFDPSSQLALVPSGEFTSSNCAEHNINYNVVKNTDDWWTPYYQYSRYNLTSAIETIQSLPYTSGNNNIKFKSDAGNGTDGGGIYLMTEEQIAVAAAKGWTVSLV